jgi:signal transduction histidine kinase
MVISMFFSASIYQLAARELDRGFKRQDTLLDRPFPNFKPGFRKEFNQNRQESLEEAKSSLLSSLLLTNFAILVLGGGLSYFLARRSLRPIEDAHRALEQFTADASHELRTPITAMKTEVEVALMQPKLTLKEAKKLLGSNVEELDNLTQLSEGLLELARMEERSLLIEKLNVSELVQSAVDKVLQKAETKNILITQEVTEDVNVAGDRVALIEALVVLLDNAVKYSPQKSTIIVSAQDSRSSVSMSVTDQGSGVSKADQPHIFDRFYRVDGSRTKQATSGHGLGLSIAKGIVESHSGDISVKNGPKKGAIFTIKLPK